MVKAWIADVSALLEEECYRRYYEALPDFRKEKADRIKVPAGRAQSVGVWALWDKIKEKYSLEFLDMEKGVNFSHSGSLVMCAAQVEGRKEARVGCDIEEKKSANIKVAARFFCAEELETIENAADKSEQDDIFFRYWVLKESFMKATRKGMGLPLDAFEIRLGSPPKLIRKPEEFEEPYYYCEYERKGLPYKMAVCSTDSDIDSEILTEFELR